MFDLQLFDPPLSERSSISGCTALHYFILLPSPPQAQLCMERDQIWGFSQTLQAPGVAFVSGDPVPGTNPSAGPVCQIGEAAWPGSRPRDSLPPPWSAPSRASHLTREEGLAWLLLAEAKWRGQRQGCWEGQ